jgi:urea carboxylase
MFELKQASTRTQREDKDQRCFPSFNRSALPDSKGIITPVSANIWQVLVEPGDGVAKGDRLIILEAMKMEIAITAEEAGAIVGVFCQKGQMVTAGQVLSAIQV